MQHMGELDGVDDELFALDYPLAGTLTATGIPLVGPDPVPTRGTGVVLPEPPTVRLAGRDGEREFDGEQGFDGERGSDGERSGEYAILLGLLLLLVGVLATVGLVLWWWS